MVACVREGGLVCVEDGVWCMLQCVVENHSGWFALASVEFVSGVCLGGNDLLMSRFGLVVWWGVFCLLCKLL